MFSEWSQWFSDPDYFRNSEEIKIDGNLIKKEKAPGEKRVLLLGDSATFGTSVEKDERFSYKLEQSLTDKWTVINAGVPGFDNIDELAVLKNKLIKLAPDFIVWQIFLANDLNYNILNTSYRLKEFFYKPHIFEKSAFLKMILFSLRGLGFNAELLLRDSLKNEENRYENTAEDHRGLKFQNYGEGEFALYHKEPSSLEPLVYDTFEYVVGEINALASKHGAKVLVLLVPTRSSIRNDLEILPDLPNAKEKLGKSDSYYQVELDYKRPLRKVIEALDNAGLSYVNPLDGGVDESFLVEGDDHPSPKGHSFYAERILDFVRGN